MRLFTAILLAWTLAAPLAAAPPSIESVSPGVGQRGTEFPLKLIGAALDGDPEFMAYSPGLTCLKCEAASENELTVHLRAEADCRLGSHAFRLRTKHGLSELLTFRLTPLPVVASQEPNDSPGDAQSVAANVTVAGVLAETGDVDSYRLALKRGERLSAEVEAVRLGGELVDTVLTVVGPDGDVLASVDDTPLFRQDPYVTLIAPADGNYIVQVRETRYAGDERSRYALHLGTFPRPAWVFPAGGQAGQSLVVQFGGDAAGTIEQRVTLSGAADRFALYATQGGQAAATGNPFRVSPFPNVLESEPNDSPGAATAAGAEFPLAFNGIIGRAGDRDCYRFHAARGTRFEFDAFASRLGSPLDSILSIEDAAGKVIVANDDEGTHDSRLVFLAPRSGDYVLSVTDKRGEGGENFIYRVEVTRPEPALAAFLPRPERTSQEGQTVVVPRGNRVVALLGAQRRGVEGDVDLTLRDLPSGVGASRSALAADRFWLPVVFEAKQDAPIGGTLAGVLASGHAGQQSVEGQFRQVVDLVGGPADALYEAAEVDRLAVAVVEDSPITLSLAEPKSPLPRDGTIQFLVEVTRAAGFEGAVEVDFPYLPPWIDGPDSITIPAGESKGSFTARAFPQAQPRSWPICAQARPAAGSGRRPAMDPGAVDLPMRRPRGSVAAPPIAVSSQLVTLQVADSPVTGSIGTIAAEQGQELKVVCTLERRGDVPARMTAALEGLPNRVGVEPVEISRDDRRVEFTVRFEPTAPVGTFTSLVCRLTGEVDGQEVSYCVGRGAVLRIEAAGRLVLDESGKPLTPLDVLRRSRKSGKEAGRADDKSQTN